jgi:hypothetical protein
MAAMLVKISAGSRVLRLVALQVGIQVLDKLPA